MGRMIYSRVVFDAATGETLEEEGRWYEGPVAECGGGKGGGGSSTTTTVDYDYNKRMATLSEEQQDWAREYFNMWQEYYKPYEIEQAQANRSVLPAETALYSRQLQSATNLLPAQEAAANKFLNTAAQGVDVQERMGLATADVANAWKDVRATAERDAARLGVNPNSGRFAGVMAGLDTERAQQLAGARTAARVQAEDENYKRLTQAAQYNATGGILQGLQLMRS